MLRLATLGLRKIISGGQTGVDRAALDFSIASGIPHGGWCPRDRKAEDGAIDAKYLLTATESPDYLPRTRQNVIDSNGTLILNLGALDGGTLRTRTIAEQTGKPHLVIQLDSDRRDDAALQCLLWLRREAIAILNVAGPRESKRPGAYAAARSFLDHLATIVAYEPMECRIGVSDPEAPGYIGTYARHPPYMKEPVK